jgi:hypothetical protein
MFIHENALFMWKCYVRCFSLNLETFHSTLQIKKVIKLSMLLRLCVCINILMNVENEKYKNLV